MYRRGCTNRNVVIMIQEALGILPDGVFGPITEKAVINFQIKNNLIADGIVGRNTLEALDILDTDLQNSIHFVTFNDLSITRHYLRPDEYVQEAVPIINDYLFLHHTAGWANPYAVIDHWNNDNRGRIATEFVIGGQDIKSEDAKYDGLVLQAFPEGCQGWHLGSIGFFYMNRHSVGIELASWGRLNGGNRTYTNVLANDNQVYELTELFRGTNKYHRYSNAQIINLKKLILYIANRDNIDVREGLVKWIHAAGPFKAFDFNEDAFNGKVKGLLSHGNVRKAKSDVFPQQELVDMLLSL